VLWRAGPSGGREPERNRARERAKERKTEQEREQKSKRVEEQEKRRARESKRAQEQERERAKEQERESEQKSNREIATRVVHLEGGAVPVLLGELGHELGRLGQHGAAASPHDVTPSTMASPWIVVVSP
jgi:hypothetical protein